MNNVANLVGHFSDGTTDTQDNIANALWDASREIVQAMAWHSTFLDLLETGTREHLTTAARLANIGSYGNKPPSQHLVGNVSASYSVLAVLLLHRLGMLKAKYKAEPIVEMGAHLYSVVHLARC
ncbi:hypothetical protein [Microvirga sp. 17 mud 1-3]|uniref:hypothetical protein n=1 Tax=Microvirga sp. 17 mud 1-3 TaxID=2082949 RepID=UPI0013A5733A|nr:hypothetical protein [Microvirga sp. 17 mud 1-3]